MTRSALVVAALAMALPAYAQEDKQVLLEVYTGAWCGFCPEASIYADELKEVWGDRLVVSFVHHDDEMAFENDPRDETTGSAYPRATVDRGLRTNRESWSDLIEERMELEPRASISLLQSYDPRTRALRVRATATFGANAANATRLRLLVMEDGVVGRGFGYDQVSIYDQVEGHPYEGAGESIVGFVHDYTLRAYPLGTEDNGAIAAGATTGQIEVEEWDLTLPIDWNVDLMSVSVFLMDDVEDEAERRVWNAIEAPLGEIPEFEVERADYVLELGPVPVGDSKQATLTISNPGTIPLAIGVAPDFEEPALSWTSDECSGQSIPPGADCQIAVQFAPIDASNVWETVSIPYDNLAGDSILVEVTGTGTSDDEDTDNDSDVDVDSDSDGTLSCGCSTSGPAGGAAGFGLLLLGLFRRRDPRRSR